MPNIKWQNQRRKVGKGAEGYNIQQEGNYQPHSSCLSINLVQKFLKKGEVSEKLIGAKWGHDSTSMCPCKFGRKFPAPAFRANWNLFCFGYFLNDVYTYHISEFSRSKLLKPSTAVDNKMKQILSHIGFSKNVVEISTSPEWTNPKTNTSQVWAVKHDRFVRPGRL